MSMMIAGALGLGLAAVAVVPSPAYASIPKHPVWESSAKFGAWHNHGFIVYNNEWNTSVAGPQTIWADSYHHFGVESKQADTTSVKTYPCVQKNYNNPALTRFKSLESSFTQSMPRASNFDAEAAYDLWLNNYKVEVMMWMDNHGQTPAGRVIARINIYGRKFAVWQSGSSMFSFVLTGKQLTSGRARLLSALRWLVKEHHLSRSATMTQVNFGWEIASTDGRPLDFTVTDYGLSSSLR
jgi:hypothetical protein